MLTDTKLVGTFHNMYLYNRVPEVTDRRWYFTPKRPKVALFKKLLLGASIISVCNHLIKDSKAVD